MITLPPRNLGMAVSKAVNLKFHVFCITVSESEMCSLINIKGKLASEIHMSGEL
jgi:hypothetical protein